MPMDATYGRAPSSVPHKPNASATQPASIDIVWSVDEAGFSSKRSTSMSSSTCYLEFEFDFDTFVI